MDARFRPADRVSPDHLPQIGLESGTWVQAAVRTHSQTLPLMFGQSLGTAQRIEVICHDTLIPLGVLPSARTGVRQTANWHRTCAIRDYRTFVPVGALAQRSLEHYTKEKDSGPIEEIRLLASEESTEVSS